MKRICIFCGSSFGKNRVYKEGVVSLGEAMAERKIELVYGGSNLGLMGEIARAVLGKNGIVYGVIPLSLSENVEPLDVTELIIAKDMHERKAKMHELSDAFIAMPGGIGTLEEIIEAMTWLQLGLHKKPVAFFNIGGFYDRLIDFLDFSAGEGFIRQIDLDRIIISDNPVELLSLIEKYKYRLPAG